MFKLLVCATYRIESSSHASACIPRRSGAGLLTWFGLLTYTNNTSGLTKGRHRYYISMLEALLT